MAGTIEPGKKARMKLAVELSAGAHGDYPVSLKYGGRSSPTSPGAWAGPGE